MIDVFDKNLKKINTIRKYTLAQYVDKFREIGTFKILAQFVDENLYLLSDEQFYILFDGRIFGRVDKVLKDSDSEYDKTIEITGQLAPVFFTQRVNYNTITYKGNTAKYIGALISHNIPTDKTDPRYLKINVHYDNESYLDANCRQIERTKTGGYMWDEMQLALEQDNLGIFFEPDFTTIGQTISDNDGVQIDAWKLVISAGTDRTRGNDKGNTPIIFSQNISNIQRSTYALQSEDYCNSAVVAGEGEGDARKWFTFDINTKEKKFEAAHGFGLRELYIDARDVQSKDSYGNTTMTDAEYEQELHNRADSKAVDAMLAKAYSSTVITSDERYVYNRDYYKGDIVTVVDNELDIMLDAQITSVTKTYQGVKEIIDIDFTYGKTEADLFGSSTSKGSAANTAAKVEDIADDIEITKDDIGKISDDIENTKDYIDYMSQDIEDIKQQIGGGGGTGTKDIVVGGKDNNEGTFTQKNDNNEEKLKIDKDGIYGANRGDGKTQSFLDVRYANWLTALAVEAGTNIKQSDIPSSNTPALSSHNFDYIKTLFANGTAYVERRVEKPVAGSSKRKARTTIGFQRPYGHEIPPDQPTLLDNEFLVDLGRVDNVKLILGNGTSSVSIGGELMHDKLGPVVPMYVQKDKYKCWRFGWDEKGFFIQDVRENLVEEEKYYFTLTPAADMNKNPSDSGSSSGSDGGHQSGGHQVGGSSSDGDTSSSGRPQADDGTE